MESMNIDYLKTLLSYDPEKGLICWLAKGKGRIKKKESGTLLSNGYVGICIGKKRFLAHRIAWAIYNNKWPEDQIDHINGIKTDNRICNLREATNSQNGKNLPISKSNKSGCKGVCFETFSNKWKAYIRINYKTISLGRFSDFDEAVKIRKEAEATYFKEWNRT